MVDYVVTDGNGNTSTCTVTFVVDDMIAPSFTCPSPMNVNLNGNCMITIPDVVTGLTGTDNCGTVTFSQSPLAGVMFSLVHNGTMSVAVTANDGNGNTTQCMVTLTAKDVTAPVLSACPTDMLNLTVNAALCQRSVVLTAPTVTENCTYTLSWAMTGANTVASTPGTIPSPYLFNVGSTVVTYTAKDAAGNMTMCSFTVSVVNTVAATITGGGTTTVNAPTTVNVTFTGSGGATKYTFGYQISVNGGPFGATQTIMTPGVASTVSIPHPNNVAGTFVYKIVSVTDFNGCSGTLPVDPANMVTVYVNPAADLSPTIAAPLNSNFIIAQVKEGYIQFTNGGTGPTTGLLTFRISRIGNFALNLPPTMLTSTDLFSVNVDNNDWDIIPGAFFYTLTPKNPLLSIPSGGNVKIGFILTSTGPGGSTGNLTATISNGTGGDNNDNNNASVRTFVINQ
jgi:hypothetical protein